MTVNPHLHSTLIHAISLPPGQCHTTIPNCVQQAVVDTMAADENKIYVKYNVLFTSSTIFVSFSLELFYLCQKIQSTRV